MAELKPLGSPARVEIRRVVRTQFRLEWEYDGSAQEWDEDGPYQARRRKRRVRFYVHKRDAYRAAAMRLIFAKRDTLCTDTDHRGYPTGCVLCAAITPSGAPDEGPEQCRYHGGDEFERLRDRLARWLQWRDEKAERGEKL